MVNGKLYYKIHECNSTSVAGVNVLDVIVRLDQCNCVRVYR